MFNKVKRKIDVISFLKYIQTLKNFIEILFDYDMYKIAKKYKMLTVKFEVHNKKLINFDKNKYPIEVAKKIADIQGKL